MNVEDIKDGGIYRIRDWDDMANEFNVSSDMFLNGIINCPGRFVQSMRYLCGRAFVFSANAMPNWPPGTAASHIQKENIDVCRGLSPIDGEDDGSIGYWTITASMLEPADEYDRQYSVPSDDEIERYLFM